MDLNELHFTYCNYNMYPSSPQHGRNLSGRAAITFGFRRCLCIRWKSAPSQHQVYTNEEISLNLYSKKI